MFCCLSAGAGVGTFRAAAAAILPAEGDPIGRHIQMVQNHNHDQCSLWVDQVP